MPASDEMQSVVGVAEQHTRSFSWSSNGYCKSLKRQSRRLLLRLHPDKFRRQYPACDPNMSQLSFVSFNKLMNELQRKHGCKHAGGGGVA